MQVAPAALARKIGVVRGGDEADGLGGAREHVAHVVGERLQLVCAELDFVVDHVVVRGARRALQTAMG